MNYVYALICPINLCIKYIGISNQPEKRLKKHVWNSEYYGEWRPKGSEKLRQKNTWLRMLKEKRLLPLMGVLYQSKDRSKALEFEQDLIDKYYNQLFNDKKRHEFTHN